MEKLERAGKLERLKSLKDGKWVARVQPKKKGGGVPFTEGLRRERLKQSEAWWLQVVASKGQGTVVIYTFD